MMRKIRILIQDACQYDCYYCPLKAGTGSLAQMGEAELLQLLVSLKDPETEIELAGGEPLLYDKAPGLIRRLKQDGLAGHLYMTTNGLLLAEKAEELKTAGLDGVNVHLDTIGAEDFTRITGCSQVLNEVLKGIWKAAAIGLPLTITTVMSEDSCAQAAVMAGLAKQMAVTIRFAEAGGVSRGIRKEQIYQKICVSAGVPIEKQDGKYHPQGWRGSFTFGRGIAGAFGMEEALILGGKLI